MQLRAQYRNASGKTRDVFRVPVARGQFTDSFIENYFKALDTPLANEALALFKTGRHADLVKLSITPEDYQNFDVFRRDYAAVSFLSKATFLRTGVDKRAVAMEKFAKNELTCAETNRRLRSDHGTSPKCLHLLSQMGYFIERILGAFDVEEFFDKARWGPGATTLLKRASASFPTKFLLERGATAILATVAREAGVFNAYPHWLEESGSISPGRFDQFRLEIQVGNKVTTVPKNAKTDRVIAIEPGLNLWFQLGLGAMIRARLRRVGINLDSQERNQLLALEGSITGLLATVDFSSASDTISRELVRRVFESRPLLKRWLTVMELTRSHFRDTGDQPVRWEKFSSMGNGFTFELETLIFYAAALACCEACGCSMQKVGVYGDDVVLPTEVVPLYEEFTTYLGFSFNQEKSFSRGWFRESCGEHYFLGVNCKPTYLKDRIQDVRQTYKAANSIRIQSHNWGLGLGCDDRFRSCWSSLVESLDPSTLLPAPKGLVSDSGVVMNLDEAMTLPPVSRRPVRPSGRSAGWEGWWTRIYARQLVYGPASRLEHSGVYLTVLRYLTNNPLDSLRERYSRWCVPVPNLTIDDVKRLTAQEFESLGANFDMHPIGVTGKVKNVFAGRWCDLGPWVKI